MKISGEKSLPAISFFYDGKPSKKFLRMWNKKVVERKTEEGSITTEIFFDPESGLKITIILRRFKDFPAALDWVMELENCGKHKTPIIEDIMALDFTFSVSRDERVILHYAKGSQCMMDDFLPLTTELFPSSKVMLAPEGGRSSNGILPFMNIQGSDCGIIIGIGWSGQWMAELNRDENQLNIKAGMEKTRFFLYPGEKIRTPRILSIEWEGYDFEKGNNLLRHLLFEHYIPRIKGNPVMPPAAYCLQWYFYLTDRANANLEMTALPKAASIGLDTYWIDACWYGGKKAWWEEVGSWTVNKEKFPHGLKPIADAAHKAGMKFVLWFEPERVRKNSIIHREHPEFLLTGNSPDNFLFNLGMPEALNYIKSVVSNHICEIGIDIYRQDFNMDPLSYWRAADTNDRQGITEIRYIEGLYKLWDELRQQHPDTAIDNCASGGRRIDLETISRAIPLWPSDFMDIGGLNTGMGIYTGSQCIKAGLARWVPLFGGGVWNFTPYGFRSAMIGGFTFGFNIEDRYLCCGDERKIKIWKDVLSKGKTLLDSDFPIKLAKKAIKEWKSIRKFFTGDFHLLLPLTISYHDWCAYQFHRNDLEEGIALFFRRHKSPFPEIEAGLKDIKTKGKYMVSLSPGFNEKSGQIMDGKNLVELRVRIADLPGSILLRYSRIK